MGTRNTRQNIDAGGRTGARATPALAALEAAGVAHHLHLVGHEKGVTAYGLEAAHGLQVEAERVFKTLVCTSGAQLGVAIVPVTDELDLKAMARALGAKSANLADAAVAERATGYVTGGISPIGQKRRLPTFVDQSATDWETIFVSGGRRGLEIELTPSDLLAVTGGQVAAIRKPRERPSSVKRDRSSHSR